REGAFIGHLSLFMIVHFSFVIICHLSLAAPSCAPRGPDGFDSPSAHEPGDYYNQSRKAGEIGSHTHERRKVRHSRSAGPSDLGLRVLQFCLLLTAYCFSPSKQIQVASKCPHFMTTKVMLLSALSQAA